MDLGHPLARQVLSVAVKLADGRHRLPEDEGQHGGGHVRQQLEHLDHPPRRRGVLREDFAPQMRGPAPQPGRLVLGSLRGGGSIGLFVPKILLAAQLDKMTLTVTKRRSTR